MLILTLHLHSLAMHNINPCDTWCIHIRNLFQILVIINYCIRLTPYLSLPPITYHYNPVAFPENVFNLFQFHDSYHALYCKSSSWICIVDIHHMLHYCISNKVRRVSIFLCSIPSQTTWRIFSNLSNRPNLWNNKSTCFKCKWSMHDLHRNNMLNFGILDLICSIHIPYFDIHSQSQKFRSACFILPQDHSHISIIFRRNTCRIYCCKNY